jgi:group I intron endonuclease
MGCLYRITSPSGKHYLGITSKTAQERWKVHVKRTREGRSQALNDAIKKYGADAFTVETLVIADKWDYLCDLERKAIAAFNTKAPNGYNLTDGGEGIVGRVHTETASKNMSAGQRKRQRTEAERQRIADASRVYWQSPAGMARKAEAAAKKEAARIERHATLKQRRSEATKKAMATPEVRAKVLACAAARAADPEWRKKISASKKGQGAGSRRSEETRAKMAEARRQWWARKNAQKTPALHED